MAVDDDRVYHRDALETFSIKASYWLGRHSIFAVRECRELWIGVAPRWIRKHSTKVRLAEYKLTEDICNT